MGNKLKTSKMSKLSRSFYSQNLCTLHIIVQTEIMCFQHHLKALGRFIAFRKLLPCPLQTTTTVVNCGWGLKRVLWIYRVPRLSSENANNAQGEYLRVDVLPNPLGRDHEVSLHHKSCWHIE